ncbi:MAG TPA: hypothetical protein VJ997_09645, partial [Longimicrobiales bacterium]|nr:hypothetical protein [Longimicrobiales bacterium]
MVAAGGGGIYFAEVESASTEGAVYQAVLQQEVYLLLYYGFTPAIKNGRLSVVLPVTLPRNGIVNRFVVRVGALRANSLIAANVAEVRVPPAGGSGSGASQMVIDFGLARTISGLGLTGAEAPLISSIHPWIGNAFQAEAMPFTPETTLNPTFDEIRTERVLVKFAASASEESLRSRLYVTLPEAPAGLELRIDGAPPVWTFPGVVQPGDSAELSEDDFSSEGFLLVDLTDEIAPLVGDPSADGDVTFELEVDARVPGVLALLEEERQVSHIERVVIPGTGIRELTFPEEGRLEIPLPLPDRGGRQIEEVRCTLVGDLGDDRVVEPLDATVATDAELVGDPDHIFAVRLRDDHGLGEISAVRLPLVAGPEGAEARIVLWRAGAGGEPDAVHEEGTTEPVTLKGGADAWTTFALASPVDLADGETLWAALVVSRGAVTWSFLDGTASAVTFSAQEVRRLEPAGGWTRLPSPFRAGGALEGLRGRVRVRGRAPKDAPLAPALLSVVEDAGAGI